MNKVLCLEDITKKFQPFKVKSARNKPGYFAEQIHEAIKGVGK
jgi:hypothetical protein